ncbi:MAG: phosphoglycerate dehydrogenase [Stomatobaculum sp.]
MGKVLVSVSYFDELCKDAMKLLKDTGHEVIFDKRMNEYPAYSFEELQKLLPEMDACIVGMDDYKNPAVWDISDRLKGVTKFGVGVDNFNLQVAAQHGKYVGNCPGGNSNSVAELTVCMILGVLRCISPLDTLVKNNEWPRYVGEELEGKIVGLYGFGAISKLIAKKLGAFDVKLISYDPYPDEKEAKRLNTKLVTEDELIEQSDVISLHAPATQENYHLFNKNVFTRMKDGAYFVNTARGALVEINDLAEALMSGKLRGAALDAFEGEGAGYLKTSPIMQCSNVILTPHTGAETYDAYRKVGLIAAQNVIDIMAGRAPKSCPNLKYFR